MAWTLTRKYISWIWNLILGWCQPSWEIVLKAHSMQTLAFDIHITLHIISTVEPLIYFLLLRENRCSLASLWPTSNYVMPWRWGSLLECARFLVQPAIQSGPLSVKNLDLIQTELLWAIWVWNNECLAYYMLSSIFYLSTDKFFPHKFYLISAPVVLVVYIHELLAWQKAKP